MLKTLAETIEEIYSYDYLEKCFDDCELEQAYDKYSVWYDMRTVAENAYEALGKNDKADACSELSDKGNAFVRKKTGFKD